MDKIMKAMYGAYAIQVPMHMFVQDQGGGTVAFIGGSRDDSMRYQSRLTHQLIVGEVIIRPHLVCESDHWRGTGLGGLLTCDATDMGEWVNHGNVICDPMGKVPKDFKQGRD